MTQAKFALVLLALSCVVAALVSGQASIEVGPGGDPQGPSPRRGPPGRGPPGRGPHGGRHPHGPPPPPPHGIPPDGIHPVNGIIAAIVTKVVGQVREAGNGTIVNVTIPDVTPLPNVTNFVIPPLVRAIQKARDTVRQALNISEDDVAEGVRAAAESAINGPNPEQDVAQIIEKVVEVYGSVSRKSFIFGPIIITEGLRISGEVIQSIARVAKEANGDDESGEVQDNGEDDDDDDGQDGEDGQDVDENDNDNGENNEEQEATTEASGSQVNATEAA